MTEDNIEVGKSIILADDYKLFIEDIKKYIQSAQIKAAVAVNQELLHLYWNLAEKIVEKQKQSVWGEGLLQQISNDLQAEFSNMKGFSTSFLLELSAGFSYIGRQYRLEINIL